MTPPSNTAKARHGPEAERHWCQSGTALRAGVVTRRWAVESGHHRCDASDELRPGARSGEGGGVSNLYFNRKCTGAMVGAHPFGGFNMSGTDSKAGGPDYLMLFLQAKSIAEKVS